MRNAVRKKVAEAIKVFTLNTELFPDNGNPWDSLGEAYVAAGNTEKAVSCYRRSIELDPKNQNAADALAKLAPKP